ncbi:MAG: pyridoxal phosphate-dependent aminotransferase, partial [Acidobacteriota bacterium]
SWLSEARSQLAETGARTARALNLPEPAGGTFLFFDASPWLDGGDDALPLLERCLDAGLLLTPGASCGRDYASWVRLCFSNLPPDQMDEATTRLSEVLSA